MNMSLATVSVGPVVLPVEVDEDTYDESIRLRRGFCPSCEEFTTPGVRASESDRECHECFSDRVCGAAHAKTAGFLVVTS